MASRVEVESGVYIDVQSTGDGPAVCLLPGFGTDASAFARQTPALSANYRVLSVNPRGIGFSDPPAPGYDLSRAVADVAAVLQEPSHLVGASLGAVVALRTAIDHPDKVRSLTLITPFLDVEDRLSVIVELWCELAAAGDHMTLALALAPWMFSATFLNDATRRGRAVSAIAQMARLIPTETLVRTRDLLGAMKTPSDDELASLPMPILVVIAGADMLTPDGESVAARFTKARVERIEGAGHAAALECPEQVNRLLLEHLGSDGRARAG
jgi:pimeloyl-ACP methyl ester carboxylesterase